MISSSETESFSASESDALGQDHVPSHSSEPFPESTKIGVPESRVIEEQLAPTADTSCASSNGTRLISTIPAERDMESINSTRMTDFALFSCRSNIMLSASPFRGRWELPKVSGSPIIIGLQDKYSTAKVVKQYMASLFCWCQSRVK